LAASHSFICFSSKDEAVAREVVEFLEAQGLKCWISLRDVAPGQNYQEAIVQAIEAAQCIVFLFSDSSAKSGEIRKELSIGGGINVPVFPLRLSPIAPTGALRYELATRQWIDIFQNREQALTRLVATIKKVIDAPASVEDEAPLQGPSGDLAAPIAATPSPATPSPAPRPRAKKPRPPPRAPIVASGTPEFEAIRAALARHVGPIAKVLVERAATAAKTPDEFSEQLANYVTAPGERAAFLEAVRGKIAAKP
jgi:hypothetical protein